MRKILRDLMPFDRVRQIMLDLPLGFSLKPLSLNIADGLVLGEDIISDINVPPFPKALKDGYAVHASDTKGALLSPVPLILKDYIPAGRGDKLFINKGETSDISTGAPLPEGSDAVVMVEDTVVENGKIVIKSEVSAGQNVLPAGADIFSGQRVLCAGDRLSPVKLGVLAAIGRVSVLVKTMRVGIIVTGDELTEPGNPLGRGGIYDTTTYTLSASIRRLGAWPISYGIIRDDRKKVEAVFLKALGECDVVLTAGSTSAGTDDFMYEIIGKYGCILVHGMKFKPGKPVIIAVADEIPVIGLPGNPTSSMMVFNELVSDLICRGLGITPSPRKKVKGKLVVDVCSDNRLDLSTVRVVREKVYPVDKTSASIATLAGADGFISIDADITRLEAGSDVEVTLFDDSIPANLVISGEICHGLDLLEELSGLHLWIRDTCSDRTGRQPANQADIIVVNLQHAPLPEHFVCIRGYSRQMGLIVAENSPVKKIENLREYTFINSCKGSNSRKLFDTILRQAAESMHIGFEELCVSIDGYEKQAKNPFEVCNAVKSGSIDAGFAPRVFAEKAGLEFIPLKTDDVDFIVPESRIELREIERFLETLRSDEFRNRLPEGLWADELTGTVLTSDTA